MLTVSNKPVPEIKKWLSTNYWKFPSGLFYSSLYVWIPIQIVNLYWVPLPFRVLYMNISVMVCTTTRSTTVSAWASNKLVCLGRYRFGLCISLRS